jgi:predicted phosphate transport protein (TIGR00153 family)
MQRLLPREHHFFALFHDLAEQGVQAAECLEKLMNDFQRLDLAVEQVDEIEHKADAIVHDIVRKLNATFVTPVLLDREDIYTIAERLDDTVDMIKGTIDRFRIFKIPAPDEHTKEMAGLIQQAIAVVHDTMRDLEGIRLEETDFCAVVNALENEGDASLKRSLAGLFDREEDARQIIKWKEIYEFLEKTLDSCEDVANLLETVIVKNA